MVPVTVRLKKTDASQEVRNGSANELDLLLTILKDAWEGTLTRASRRRWRLGRNAPSPCRCKGVPPR